MFSSNALAFADVTVHVFFIQIYIFYIFFKNREVFKVSRVLKVPYGQTKDWEGIQQIAKLLALLKA